MRIDSRPLSDRRPAAVAQLSVLPVFLELRGKSVIVAGGSDAAAWKAELLAAAGARVLVYASPQTLCERFIQLLESHHPDGQVSRAGERLSPAAFTDIALVVAEVKTEHEAAYVQRAARQSGVPLNVIDQPAFCDFQFGSIVNRSPVVVGISTGGAAPILAQAIRRKIETLLPPSVSGWADLAQRMRSLVNSRIEPGLRRRAFWQRLVDRAFGPPPSSIDEIALADDLGRIGLSDAEPVGRVTLVGAGPGDPELLTLKAVRALQTADIILFDDLVPDGALELARREARLIPVGKRAGRPSCRQDDINELMVKFARQGMQVVRLKSGDPMIFSRAGEEIAHLDARNIPVDVVPGVTAGLALAATLGLSLTHRDFARSLRFVTGHSRHGDLPRDLDWGAVADR
jgi:uroporphyrin-III C-methyltransferase/precorrin-2 dehydrogenase/sirohydrochlorin ferrochelatase